MTDAVDQGTVDCAAAKLKPADIPTSQRVIPVTKAAPHHESEILETCLLKRTPGSAVIMHSSRTMAEAGLSSRTAPATKEQYTV